MCHLSLHSDFRHPAQSTEKRTAKLEGSLMELAWIRSARLKEITQSFPLTALCFKLQGGSGERELETTQPA